MTPEIEARDQRVRSSVRQKPKIEWTGVPPQNLFGEGKMTNLGRSTCSWSSSHTKILEVFVGQREYISLRLLGTSMHSTVDGSTEWRR